MNMAATFSVKNPIFLLQTFDSPPLRLPLPPARPRSFPSVSLRRRRHPAAAEACRAMTIEGEETASWLLITLDAEEAAAAAAAAENSSRPWRIALFVEPSPFVYVSGYKNRFQNFIKHLCEMGDEVIVMTTYEGVPQEFYGAKLIGS